MTLTSKQVGNDGGRKPPIKADTKFKCPKCGRSVTTHVGLWYVPACMNHSGGLVTMEEDAK